MREFGQGFGRQSISGDNWVKQIQNGPHWERLTLTWPSVLSDVGDLPSGVGTKPKHNDAGIPCRSLVLHFHEIFVGEDDSM